MSEPIYSEFEQGERQALLQVRSFIAMRGKAEVDQFVAQRLHDIAMDADRRTLGYVTYRTKQDAMVTQFGDLTKGIPVPPSAKLIAAGLVGPGTPQPPRSLSHSIVAGTANAADQEAQQANG